MSMVIITEIVVGIIILAAVVWFAVRDTRQRRDATGEQRFDDVAEVPARETPQVPAPDTAEVSARDTAKVSVPDTAEVPVRSGEQDAEQPSEVVNRV